MPRNTGSNGSFVQKVCESSPAKTIGLVSAVIGLLLGLGSILHKQQPAGTIKEAAPAVFAAAGGSGTTPLPRSTPRSTVQSSYGVQSPNVSGVQHGVQIQYASAALPMPEGSPEHRLPVVPASSAPTGSTIQISHGAQSPNVSGVRGNVDIRYGAATAASEEKLPETK